MLGEEGGCPFLCFSRQKDNHFPLGYVLWEGVSVWLGVLAGNFRLFLAWKPWLCKVKSPWVSVWWCAGRTMPGAHVMEPGQHATMCCQHDRQGTISPASEVQEQTDSKQHYTSFCICAFLILLIVCTETGMCKEKYSSTVWANMHRVHVIYTHSGGQNQ